MFPVFYSKEKREKRREKREEKSRAEQSTEWYRAAQHSTARHGTARHSTAQHSAAQHSTAQHISCGDLVNFKMPTMCLWSLIIPILLLSGMDTDTDKELQYEESPKIDK